MRVMMLVKATADSEKGFQRTADTEAMMQAMAQQMAMAQQAAIAQQAAMRSGRPAGAALGSGVQLAAMAAPLQPSMCACGLTTASK